MQFAHDVNRLALFVLLLLLPRAEAADELAPDGSAGARPAALVLSHDAVPQPVKSSQRRRSRLVYACHDVSVPVFSDRPCGADADAWRIDLPPSTPTGAAPSTRTGAPAAATRPIAAARPRDDRPRPPDRCARLEEQLAAINARMREGYSAREAARLWQRWRDAKARLRAERC
jgi:hypothetical protein